MGNEINERSPEFPFENWEINNLPDDDPLLPPRLTRNIDKLTKLTKLFNRILIGDDESLDLARQTIASEMEDPIEAQRVLSLGGQQLLDEFTRTNWHTWSDEKKEDYNLRRVRANLPKLEI